MIALSRSEAIDKITDSMVEVAGQTHGWVRRALREGLDSYDDMSIEMLEVEMNAFYDEPHQITED